MSDGVTIELSSEPGDDPVFRLAAMGLTERGEEATVAVSLNIAELFALATAIHAAGYNAAGPYLRKRGHGVLVDALESLRAV